MDYSDLFQLGLDTLPWVSGRIIEFGIGAKDAEAGTLGGALFTMAKEMESPGYQIDHGKLKALLGIVDKACTVSSPFIIVRKALFD